MTKHTLLFVLGFFGAFSTQAQNPLRIPDTLSGPVMDLELQSGTNVFYPGFATGTLGANGPFMAPTLMLRRNRPVQLRVQNNLSDTTTIHWHGLHVPASADGGPHSYIPSGTLWAPSFTVLDWAGTYWYHPHHHLHTNAQVSKGLTGFIVVRDSLEDALTLPKRYGVDDIPLLLQTKGFNAQKEITYDHPMDTAVMANGTLRAVHTLPAQVVRLRLLNGCSERVLRLGFHNNESFWQIASDGGLLSAPVSLNRIQLGPGERADILVNLSNRVGQSLQLKCFGSELPNAVYGATQPGMGPGQVIPGYSSNPLNGNDFTFVTFSVGAIQAPAVQTIPSTLVNHQPWSATMADTTRVLTFMPQNMGPTAIQGPFMINNAHFDMSVINQYVPVGRTEIWELVNQTPIAHPFHIHHNSFYILSVNNQPPSASLAGRKDVVMVPGGMGRVRFIMKFENFYDDVVPYMYHCHMLTHEDHGMMGQFIVQSPRVSSVEEGLPALGPSLLIGPQPATTHLKVQIKDSRGPATLRVYSLTGALVKSVPVEASVVDLDIADLEPSIYLLEWKGSGKVYRTKFLKKSGF
ncbi:MAG: multicopper oxidase domain-containing protein [Bacteroidia bacterium]